MRADLHGRFAAWLEQHGSELVELDEILGYHLEQAARYREELGRADAALAEAAGERLAAAGRNALARQDFRAAAALVERSLALTRPFRLDVHLELDLVDALQWADTSRGVEIADTAARRADTLGDEVGAALARTVAAQMRVHRSECSADELERCARAALPLLEAAGDDAGLVHVWGALGDGVANIRCRFEEWAQAEERALLHARRAVWPILDFTRVAVPLAKGPRPASEALSTLDALLPDQPRPQDLVMRALLLAMLGQIEEAWEIAVPADERLREFGVDTAGIWLAEIAILRGDYAAAAAYLRSACDALEASGNTGVLSSYAPRLGRVLCALGRYDEAEPLALRGRELGDPEDVLTQVYWRQTQALVHSARGQHTDADKHAREAVEFAMRSDSLAHQGDALFDLGEVLKAAGRREDAAAAWQDALDRYERKQIIPLGARVRERLASLQAAATPLECVTEKDELR